MLGIHEETVRREVRAGRLLAKQMGRKILITAASLQEFLQPQLPRAQEEVAQ